MSKQPLPIFSGIMIEANDCLTLDELIALLHTENDVIYKLVELELISPQGDSPTAWRFDSVCITRARKAVSFHHDLGVNFNGIALAMDLLDQIEQLESQLQK